MLYATGADAQSTSNLGVADEPQRVELTVGREFDSRSGPPDNSSERSVIAGALSVRRDRDGTGGFLFALRGYELTRIRELTYPTNGYAFEDKEYVVALTAASDWMFRPTRTFSIAPSLGIGIVPFAHSTHRIPGLVGSGRPSTSAAGLMWTTGIALRYGHVIVQQDLSGAYTPWRDVISAAAYWPTMIGWRF